MTKLSYRPHYLTITVVTFSNINNTPMATIQIMKQGYSHTSLRSKTPHEAATLSMLLKGMMSMACVSWSWMRRCSSVSHASGIRSPMYFCCSVRFTMISRSGSIPCNMKKPFIFSSVLHKPCNFRRYLVNSPPRQDPFCRLSIPRHLPSHRFNHPRQVSLDWLNLKIHTFVHVWKTFIPKVFKEILKNSWVALW